ncbi:MAG: tol-pal system protein YbgF [Candidatus Aminicenantes bacterium]
MGKKFSSGIFLILFLSLLLGGADKEKKAYELIYKDVQLLKQKVLQLDEKIESDTADIKLIKKQLGELLTLVKLFQSEQASFKDDQKKIASQYLILLEKIESMNSQMAKFSEELLEIKNVARSQLLPQEERPTETTSPPQQAKPQEKKPQEEPPQTPLLPPTLSPQEVYNMAYSDYLKGNFELAIQGFLLYREQFPESPLADNALYWIGECYFSQSQYEKAIQQFNNLILKYGHADKAPAAYLKKGISLMELGKNEQALAVFKLLISKYPLEEETKIAQQKIKELQSENEGH